MIFIWHVFIDLHNVIVKIEAVGRRYREFVLNALTIAGVDEDVGAKAFNKAHQYWIAEFKHLNCKRDPLSNPMEEFMKKMRKIDKKWINIILEVVPSNKREHVAIELSTENAEHGAMASGSMNDLHLDAIQAIRQIASWDDVRIHVASSARSSHIKGVVDLAGLENIIDTIIGFDTVQAPKKAPGSKYYERMLEKVHASPENSF
ncbi:hypothetical protein GF325_19285, partial [Candidatus Bathyarchaeota archaeon]|nr:hypothetical protein [Candidatus Bathyarchaeota archaeon]